MAYKTFISYKYSEGRHLRNRILTALGDDASYYQGETSDSPDMSDRTTNYIKERLKDMIYSTTVTILIISPNMKESNWINWEIEYSLKDIKRNDRKSTTNGVVGVIMKVKENYSWFRSTITNLDGHTSYTFDDSYLYDVVVKNRFNRKPIEYLCDECKTVDGLSASYISLVPEEDFLENPDRYIENAYNKSKQLSKYNISKKN